MRFQDISVGKPRCTGNDRKEARRVPGNRGKDQERMCREQMRTCDLTMEGKPKAPRQSRDLGVRQGGSLVSKRRAEGKVQDLGIRGEASPHKQASAPSKGNTGVSGERRGAGDGPAKSGCYRQQELQAKLLLGRCRQAGLCDPVKLW